MSTQNEKEIWIVDDDTEDHELITYLFKELKWTYSLQLFESGEQLLEKLADSHEAPFIIISDVNLPKLDGFALREKMLQTANNKFHSVPFIFWSTQASELQVRKAFMLRAQGFFKKDSSFSQWKLTLMKIVDYWTSSLMPSKEDKQDEPML
jgi:CheY-like chemotaxis protein